MTFSQPGIPSTVCTPCEEEAEDNSEHGLLTWSYIRVGAENLLLARLHEDPNMTLERTRLKSKVFSLESLFTLTFSLVPSPSNIGLTLPGRGGLFGPPLTFLFVASKRMYMLVRNFLTFLKYQKPKF